MQFTSGSTGEPRGIELSLDALDANLTSMYHWLAPSDGAVVCSWLPLSHDMGLIGLALYAMCSVNPPWSVASDLVLMTPEAFLAHPASWMRACTDYRATTTTSPPFALRLAARSLRSGSFDLSSLRSFVVGSEPVPADGLREFEAIARDSGLPPTVLCPGYGMAEAALAVAIDPTTRSWSSVHVDTEGLAAGEWQRGRRRRNRARLVWTARVGHAGPDDRDGSARGTRGPEPLVAQPVRWGGLVAAHP